MIRINLLPYRTQLRQKQILQHVIAALSVVLIAALLVFTIDTFKTMELSELEEEFGQVRAQNIALNKKIGKLKNLDRLRADVQRKLKLVDQLQQGRFYSLETLNELANVIPENVWITSYSDRAGELKMSGLGESNKAVANFMRALDKSEIFDDVALQVIKRSMLNGSAVRSFQLTLKRIDRPEDEKMTGKGKSS